MNFQELKDVCLHWIRMIKRKTQDEATGINEMDEEDQTMLLHLMMK